MATTMQRDLAVDLAEFATSLRFEDLPLDVVSTLKSLVLDCLSTTLAANTLGVGCRELLAVARHAGGTPECMLIGFGDRVPAMWAALANGGMAHALNYDDTTSRGQGHLGPTSLPTALAAADVVGGISGKDLLVALTVASEVMSRIGIALTEAETKFVESKPQPTQMPGYFSCAISAGRVFGFDVTTMHSALGLAHMQAAGGRQPVLEGRPAKAVYAAFSNQGGMLSALLAREGLRGDCDVFEGEAGFFNTYYGGRFVREALTDGLGTEFQLLNVGFKPWPTTGVAHRFIEAAITLRAQHRLTPDRIAAVHLVGDPHVRTFCEPAATRRRPQSPVHAEDSIPFAVAKALANGRIGLADLQVDQLGQPEALAIVDRLTYEIDDTHQRAGTLTVTTTDGEVYTTQVTKPLGHPSKPLTRELAWEKLVDCARFAGNPLPEAALREGVAMVDHLDELDDVRKLTAHFSGVR